MSGRRHSIAVAGAGIGGLTAALLLSRAGFAVSLIEKRTRVEEEGAGLQLSPNASRILIGAGLGHVLSRRAIAPECVRIRRGKDGRDLATIPLGQTIKKRHGAPYLVIHRAELASLLLDAVRASPGVRLLYGREARGVAEHDGGITVSLHGDRGSESALEASALVAAEGIWSAHAPADSLPRFSGFCAWRALVPAASAPELVGSGEVGLWLGPRAHLVHYPLKNAGVVNVVAVIEDRRPRAGWSRAGEKGVIAGAFAGWAEVPRALIASAPSWKCWSLFDRKPARRWGNGLVTPLGDAAHPILPFLAQGAALAVEDAAVLAANLAPMAKPDEIIVGGLNDAKTQRSEAQGSADIGRALRRYEGERAARTIRAQREARRNMLAYHATFPLSLVRDLVLARASGEQLLARFDWLYGWSADQSSVQH